MHESRKKWDSTLRWDRAVTAAGTKYQYPGRVQKVVPEKRKDLWAHKSKLLEFEVSRTSQRVGVRKRRKREINSKYLELSRVNSVRLRYMELHP